MNNHDQDYILRMGPYMGYSDLTHATPPFLFRLAHNRIAIRSVHSIDMAPKQKKGGHATMIPSNFESSKKQMDAALDQLVHTPHAERVVIAKPLWEKMSAKQREEELAVSCQQARLAARAIAEQARKVSSNAIKGGWEIDPWTQEQLKAESTLDVALARLESHGTWKRWSCHICPDGTYFYDAESFRSHMSAQHLSTERQVLIPEANDSKVT